MASSQDLFCRSTDYWKYFEPPNYFPANKISLTKIGIVINKKIIEDNIFLVIYNQHLSATTKPI